ncbi:MAG: AraC family transcriptional regulator [Oscillospiraceae bacterium]|jgi:AraC-like DNA-binding protein/mannose-6-phosphate isomerase-like protein (cupin superfamily)|nr:AraC family transcriptional regulator [Oscillospiraceae bacterium]
MKADNNYGRIKTDETLRETVCHGSDEYPFKYYKEDIWLFDFHCIDWHWHSEVEFVFIENGTAEFLVGSGRHVLTSGTGIFINSQVIHRFEASESVIIPNIVFSPSLLSPEESLIYRKYIQPLLDSSMECLILSPEIPWQNDVLKDLLSVFNIQEKEDLCELKTAELLLKIWSSVYENVNISERVPSSKASAHTQAQLQIMMQYIHKNYREHITLENIAQTVSLSKSSALNIFSKYLHISPVSYLVNYRLKRSAKLLASTDGSIYSIARDTGFENVGYFCRKFKKLFGVTPGEYRKTEK